MSDTTATPAPAPYAEIVRAAPDDLDERNHVNNVVYVRWIQHIATAHWRALASSADRAAIAWVVLRHEIDYLHPALLGDEIVLRTWVGAASGLSFERHTEIVRRGDGRILARARTRWCPVDAQTGRPRRVGPEVRSLFSTKQEEKGSSRGSGDGVRGE